MLCIAGILGHDLQTCRQNRCVGRFGIHSPSVDVERMLNRDVFRHKTLKYLLELCGLGRAFAESKAARRLAGKMAESMECIRRSAHCLKLL